MIPISKLISDGGAYEGNEIFKFLADSGILPCIKARMNSRVQLKKGNIFRNLSVFARKMIYKNGKRIAEDMKRIDGLQKLYSLAF